jgi:hypothetical protein
MASILNNLDRESVLLLYLSDDLLPADRSSVEQLLSRDAAARDELEQLRGVQQSAFAALARADTHRPLPTSEGAAVRRFARDAQQWQVDRLTRRREPGGERSRGFGWAYTAGGIAAVIALSMWIWYRASSNDTDHLAAQSTPAAELDPNAPGDGNGTDQNTNNGTGGGGDTRVAETPANNPPAPTTNGSGDDASSVTAVADAILPASTPAVAHDRQGEASAEQQLDALSLLSESVR